MSDASAAVLYLRVSSAEQVAGTSLATQERDCRAAASRAGLAVRAVYRDEGKSAKSVVGRDGLAAAVAEAERCAGVLVCYKFDRLARNAADAIQVRDALVARGCRILSATEGDATASPIAKAIFGMASIFAELDNAQRAERSRRGMAERADAGG
jgi:site-specific DNA recombinase